MDGEQLLLDPQILDQARVFLGSRFALVLQLYLDDTRARLEALAQALAPPCDRDRIILSAHSIRSASAHMGALRMSDVAAAMESTARESADMAALAPLLAGMRRTFDETERLLTPLCREQTVA